MEALITGRELSRRLNTASGGLVTRLRRAGILPDAIAINDGRPPLLLFRVARLPELRVQLSTKPKPILP